MNPKLMHLSMEHSRWLFSPENTMFSGLVSAEVEAEVAFARAEVVVGWIMCRLRYARHRRIIQGS